MESFNAAFYYNGKKAKNHQGCDLVVYPWLFHTEFKFFTDWKLLE